MQHFVQHRVNTMAQLLLADPKGGVEIDLRSDVHRPRGLHLSHDPWSLGEDFDVWLKAYARLGFAGPLVLNTKEDGLEDAILERLKAAHIGHFFFLDTAPPTLVRLLALGLGAHLSLRVSSLETAQAAQTWLAAPEPQHRPAWAWLDCFAGEPLTEPLVAPLLHNCPELKICLVSPELQRAPLARIPLFLALARLSAAICTKQPDAWTQAMSENTV